MLTITAKRGYLELEYTIPESTPDGLYTLIITGQDNLGNTATNYIPLTIDNTPTIPPSTSTLTGKVTPDISRSGDQLTVEAFSGPEATTLDAVILGTTHHLIQQADGTWKHTYTIPNTPDGTYPVLLTATDNNGTQKNTTLSLTIDNTPPQIDATLTPELVRTGNIITITVTTSSDAEKVTASILGETLKLKKQSTNSWMLRYAVPQATDGSHNILITATDKAGNPAQTTLNFTVDNTPPTLNPTINQTLVKSSDKITITTTADNDTQSVKAYIQDNTYELTKNPNNTWSLEYTTPTTGDGVYSIILMARDMVGNINHTPLTFTVDNTPPVINPEINPESAKPGENITITAHVSPDTQNMVAIIGTQRINLILSNGTWTTNYTIPLDATFDIHTIQIEGTDQVGNVGKNMASYEVRDPNPNPGPGLNPGPGPGPEPNPGPEPTPSPLNTPHTQLQRDIAGVRQEVQQGSFQDEMNQSVIPDWKEDPSPPPTNEEYEGWLNTMLKFSVEVAILAFIEFTPTGGSATGEYLQGIKTTFLNNFKALNTIKSYFSNSKYIGRITDSLDKVNKAVNNPTVQKALKAWDSFLNKVGFNYGMSVFKKGLYKLFPDKKSEIDSLLLLFSSWQFLNDPDGTINAIIDTITSLMKGKLPDRESFEKIFIFDPAQDK